MPVHNRSPSKYSCPHSVAPSKRLPVRQLRSVPFHSVISPLTLPPRLPLTHACTCISTPTCTWRAGEGERLRGWGWGWGGEGWGGQAFWWGWSAGSSSDSVSASFTHFLAHPTYTSAHPHRIAKPDTHHPLALCQLPLSSTTMCSSTPMCSSTTHVIFHHHGRCILHRHTTVTSNKPKLVM